VTRRLRAFGTAVRVFDPFVPADRVAAAGAEAVSLDELLESCDAISLHAPVTDETRGLIGAPELARMHAGAVLVNTARAALVDEEALVRALESGHLGGAALDVFSVEPPGSDHPLLQLPQVIATPHVGGNTAEVAGHQGRSVAEDLERLLRGERPHAILNPEVLDSFDWAAERPTLPPEQLAALAERPAPAVSDLQRDDATPRKSPEPAASTSGALPAETCRRMERILAGFVERAVVSDVLRDHARRTDVTLHFRIPDVATEFHLTLKDGRVTGAVAAPERCAEVELKLAADVLDGMFTGRVNAMQSAMDGKLSFTGDTAKAMTLQDLQGELSRCYGAARDDVGDPGNLEAGAVPPAAAGAPIDDVRVDIVRAVNELYAQEMITATGGNVSARAPGEDRIWITPSQLFKGDLRPEVLVPLGLDATPLDPDARAPSSERKIHCAIYAARPEAGAVIHTHAPHATILANTDLPFLPISTEAAFFGNIPRLPFIMPGTDALAEAVGLAAREDWAILLKNHGLIVAGRSLRRAADMSEIIERTAEVILGCYAVGREPPVLPDEAVETLRKMGDLIA
jgi:autoinducer 2 (AI-2) kinase